MVEVKNWPLTVSRRFLEMVLRAMKFSVKASFCAAPDVERHVADVE
jgi:hypothetical protein